MFASSTPTSRGKFNRCPEEPLGVGIRFITTVKRVIFASENIRERPVFCREELFAVFIFATVFIVGVSNVGRATFMNEQACVESCVRGLVAATMPTRGMASEELDIWRELNNGLQHILLAYVFDTDIVGQVKLSFGPEVH